MAAPENVVKLRDDVHQSLPVKIIDVADNVQRQAQYVHGEEGRRIEAVHRGPVASVGHDDIRAGQEHVRVEKSTTTHRCHNDIRAAQEHVRVEQSSTAHGCHKPSASSASKDRISLAQVIDCHLTLREGFFVHFPVQTVTEHFILSLRVRGSVREMRLVSLFSDLAFSGDLLRDASTSKSRRRFFDVLTAGELTFDETHCDLLPAFLSLYNLAQDFLSLT